MLLRKNILFFACLIGAPVFSNAAELPFKSAACEFLGTFQQNKFIEKLDRPLTSSGQFYHHCEHGVIWSTSEPIAETLILRKKGGAFLANANGVEALKSRQGKFLSELLNSLMSGDQAELNAQFDINIVDQNRYQLFPRKRKLKRGIKTIGLTFNNNALAIMVVDRNSQKTQILSKQTEAFGIDSGLEQAMEHCQEKFAERLCSRLFVSKPKISNADNSNNSGSNIINLKSKISD